jgi:hypothetical protein
MLKIINRIDNVLSRNMTNSTVTFVVIILGLLYIFMIKKIPTEFLNLINQTPSKVLVALLIAYLSCLDPVLAVGLTTLFILSLQELQLRNIVSPRKLVNTNYLVSDEDGIGNNRVSRSDVSKNFLEERIVRSSKDPKVRQLRLEDRESSPSVNPADRTLTDNIDGNKAYVSLKKMRDAQSNLVTGADPEKPLEIFPNILNAQGMNQGLKLPSGNDPEASSASLF